MCDNYMVNNKDSVIIRPLKMKRHHIGSFFLAFKAPKKLFHSGPASTNPPPPTLSVVGPLMEELFFGFPDLVSITLRLLKFQILQIWA